MALSRLLTFDTRRIWRCVAGLLALAPFAVGWPAGVAGAQGASCAFSDGFQVLSTAVPAIVGTCTEQPRANADGAVSQRTTQGLLVWHREDNWSAFTDGTRTWVAGPFGVMVRRNTERFPWEADQAGGEAVPAWIPEAAELPRPLPFVSQSLNNCGPASVSAVLGYWGVLRSQEDVGDVLRADGDPAGMVAFGLPAYARGLGLSVLMGVEGTDRTVEALVANGFPVIVDQWVSPSETWEHYRSVTAFDRSRATFTLSDPYLGAETVISAAEFEQDWRSDNGRFYVVYPPALHGTVASALALAGWSPEQAFASDAGESWLRATQDPGAGFGPGYDELNIAWDDLELGDPAGARHALAAAEVQGASPVRIGWITRELEVRSWAPVFWRGGPPA